MRHENLYFPSNNEEKENIRYWRTQWRLSHLIINVLICCHYCSLIRSVLSLLCHVTNFSLPTFKELQSFIDQQIPFFFFISFCNKSLYCPTFLKKERKQSCLIHFLSLLHWNDIIFLSKTFCRCYVLLLIVIILVLRNFKSLSIICQRSTLNSSSNKLKYLITKSDILKCINKLYLNCYLSVQMIKFFFILVPSKVKARKSIICHPTTRNLLFFGVFFVCSPYFFIIFFGIYMYFFIFIRI